MDDILVKLLRDILINNLKDYYEKGSVTFKSTINKKYVDAILFNIITDSFSNISKHFALPICIIDKIDFSNISFENFDARGFDFTKIYGVKLDPQTVYNKDLSYARLGGVIITNTFDNVVCNGTDFNNQIIHIKTLKKINNSK